MAGKFAGFVLFAEMRTGSNFLEEVLNTTPVIASFGEVFNPTFIGKPNQGDLLGFDLMRREKDPIGLVEAILNHGTSINGFRFFHDHDQRVLDRVLPDPRIAKVILRRAPLDSYISHKIAVETGQWKLTDMRNRRSAKVTFDPTEFEQLLHAWSSFQRTLRGALQKTGQAAFEIGFDDLSDAKVLDGLLSFLDIPERVDLTQTKLKRQNPEDIKEKVTNWEDMHIALQSLGASSVKEALDLTRDLPPRVRRFVADPTGRYLFQPVAGSSRHILDWLEDTAGRDLTSNMKQQELRQWMKENPQHRRFTLIRHPLARAHHVFCRDILPGQRPRFVELRRILRNRYKIALPKGGPDESYTIAQHAQAFKDWLAFLRGCLAWQTSIAPQPAWQFQTDLVHSMGRFASVDLVVREGDPLLGGCLEDLVGGELPTAPQDTPFALSEIVSLDLADAAFAVYRKDYVHFGFPRCP